MTSQITAGLQTTMGRGGVDGALQTSPPPVAAAHYEPTIPATNTTPAAVVASGPEKVAREIVRLQRERDDAVAAAARAAHAALEAQGVAEDARVIIAAAAARAAATATGLNPVNDGGGARRDREQDWGSVAYHQGFPDLDAGRHAAEVAAFELHIKELQSALRLRDGEARRTAAQQSADFAAETEALRTELGALRDRLRYAASDTSRISALGTGVGLELPQQPRQNLRHQPPPHTQQRSEGDQPGSSTDVEASRETAADRIADAENRARAAEAEVDATRERLAELEALHRTAQETALRGERQLVTAKKDLAAAGKRVGAGGVSAEARLSARVSELVLAERAARDDAMSARSELAAATRHIAELEDMAAAAGDALLARSSPEVSPVANTAAAAAAAAGWNSNTAAAGARGLEAARNDAVDSEAASSALRARLNAAERQRGLAEDRLGAAEVRWCNERARLESKLRAARDDGSVRVQSLEATVTSLRSRSGLHSEVARLGDEITQLRRGETRIRHELTFAEERLGHALLELQQLRGGDREHDGDYDGGGGKSVTIGRFGNEDALRAGAHAVRGNADSTGNSNGASGQLQQQYVSYAAAAGASTATAAASDRSSREGALERAQDRLVSLEKDAVRYQTEVERLRDEVEGATLERGREAAARADASRELAAALERIAERDRTLHDAREAAALGKERAAAARAHELTAATRRSAAAETRASEAGAAAAAAREDARDARGECARRVAAAATQRSRAEAAATTAREAEAAAVTEAAAARREAERAAALLEERGVQLQILTETIEALQSAAGSGDREQRVVTLAAQAATARASEAALERRCVELAGDSQAHLVRCARLEAQVATAHRTAAATEARAREARAREELAHQESAAARSETAARSEELAVLARRCDANTEARVSAESREASARKALEAQHARHLEQLSAEREAAADRMQSAEVNAARAVAVASGAAAADDAAKEDGAAAIMHPDDAVAAARDASAVRKRIERGLADIVSVARSRLGMLSAAAGDCGVNTSGTNEEDKENVGDAAGHAVHHVGKATAATALRCGDGDWAAAVIQRLRQLVLEAEREVGRAMSSARSAHAGESAASRRASAAEAALDARTAAWEEASAAAAAAEERLARRAAVVGACADQRLGLAQQRVGQLAESLASAGRRLVAAESAAWSSAAAAKAEALRADALGRRARVAEADAAAATQSAAAAAEELEGSPASSDAVRDLKSYFDSEVIRALVAGGGGSSGGGALQGAAHAEAAAASTTRALLGDGRLLGVTRELCATKVTERSLLASLAAARRRSDATGAHAAELQACLDAAETRIVLLQGGGDEGVGGFGGVDCGDAWWALGADADGPEALAAQLATRAHEAYAAREDVLRLRQRVSELELEVADLAGAREAAAASAAGARDGARAEISAAAARAADSFAAKAGSMRRELEGERSVLQAAMREAQAQALAARAEAAAAVASASERADVAERASHGAESRGAGAAHAAAEEEVLALQAAAARAEAKAEKANDRSRAAQRAAAELRDEVQLKADVIDQLRRAFASLDGGGSGGGAGSTSTSTPGAGKRVVRQRSSISAGASSGRKADIAARSFSPTARTRGAGGGDSSLASARQLIAQQPIISGGGAASTAGALGRRLVEAKLAEADAHRKLKVAARAEMELQQIVAKREARIVELKRQLADKSKALHDAKWSQPPPAVAAAGRAAAAAAAAERETREVRARADRYDFDNDDGSPVGRDGYSGSISGGGDRGVGWDEGGSPTFLRGRPEPMHSSVRTSGGARVQYEQIDRGDEGTSSGGGGTRGSVSLESENARLRAERSRAEAEVEKVRAEYAAAVAYAPTPEEMEVLQDEVLELRRRVTAAASGTSAHGGGHIGGGDESGMSRSSDAAMKVEDMNVMVARELQADVNAAVTAAAAALTGAPPPPPPGSRGALPPPPPGSAAAAVQQLSAALRDAQNAVNKAKHDTAEAKRSVRESGKEKAAVAGVEASQRSVIRELTQRAAALGRDKGELVDERDKLRERLRALKASTHGLGGGGNFDTIDRRPWANHGGDTPAGSSPRTPQASVSVIMAPQHAPAFPNLSNFPHLPQRPPLVLHSEASTQAGAARGAGVLVDASALTQLLWQQLAGFEPASAVVTAAAAAGSDATLARTANALSVETAAMRAVLTALSSEEARELSPTELVTKAATAAMAAMPSAPLVHTILPSIVAPVVAVAPLAADRNTVQAPMALAAVVRCSRATDTEGLFRPTLCVDAATDAAPVTVEMRSGPDGASDPVLVAAPRDAATSPGASARGYSRDVSTGVGTSMSPPPGRRVLRDTGCDPAPLTFDAQVGTDVGGAAVDAGVSAATERDALQSFLTEETAAAQVRAATAATELETERKASLAATVKAKKWKQRTSSLRIDLASAMEKTADVERRLAEETGELQLRLHTEESARISLERASQLLIEPPLSGPQSPSPPMAPPPPQSPMVQQNPDTVQPATNAAAASAAATVGTASVDRSVDAARRETQSAHAKADAARRDATAAGLETQRLQTELKGRDAEHAQMITALRATIRGMRNSTPADRAAYLEVGGEWAWINQLRVARFAMQGLSFYDCFLTCCTLGRTRGRLGIKTFLTLKPELRLPTL
jgi:hypothetical protein